MAQEIEIFVTDTNGKETVLKAQTGQTLMHVLTENDFDLRAECGGCLACATCHVYIDQAWLDKLSAKSSDEEDMLDFAEAVRDNSRLSCQIELSPALDGIRLIIAPAI